MEKGKKKSMKITSKLDKIRIRTEKIKSKSEKIRCKKSKKIDQTKEDIIKLNPIDNDHIKKTVDSFQKYYNIKHKAVDILNQKKNVYLEVIFKRVPVNKDTYCKVIGPLPNAVHDLNEMQICMFVRDPSPSKKLKDRELDLNATKDQYQRLLEDAGLPKKLISNITILPMRELMSEYTTYQARNKLAASFDLFLVDWKLMNNKFKFLKRFLGGAFNDRQKKLPIPVKLNEPTKLKSNFIRVLRSTNFFISGHGNSSNILIGQVDFKSNVLASNLIHVINDLEIYYELIATLRICGLKSDGFAFYADFRKQTVEEFESKFPLTKRKKLKVNYDKQFDKVGSEEEMSETEIETKDGKHEIVRKKVRYEDISIF